MKSALNSLIFFILGAVFSAAIILLVLRINPDDNKTSSVTLDSSEEPTRNVQVIKAALGSLRPSLDVTGEVIAESNVEIFPEVTGKVVSVGSKVGDSVIKGQSVIAMLDPSRPGVPYGLSPVLSPISGVITGITVQVGASVTPQSSLATVGNLGMPRVEVLVPETLINDLQVGQSSEIKFASRPGLTLKAVVDRLSPVVDQVSRTKRVTLRFIDNTPSVIPGLFARVRILLNPLPAKILVPQRAVLSSGEGFFVYVNVQGTAQRREVVPGQSSNGVMEILKGLRSEEIVVVAGQEMLEEGIKIKTHELSGGINP